MNQSHISLRDDYEVTGVELDTLAALAWEQPGVVGSRMTGAGFGGCTVSIVKKDKVNDFIKNVGEAYKNKIGYAADFYIASVSDGAKKTINKTKYDNHQQKPVRYSQRTGCLSIYLTERQWISRVCFELRRYYYRNSCKDKHNVLKT